jgi:hypothetical protein
VAVVTGFGTEGMGGRVEAGLEDEDVLFSHGFGDLDAGFVVRELLYRTRCQADPEPVEEAEHQRTKAGKEMKRCDVARTAPGPFLAPQPRRIVLR